MMRGRCLACVLVLAAACGRAAPSFPSGSGTPFPEFASAYDDATAACRGVKTLTASMALSGTAARTKLRGRIDSGFAAPSRMRLEGRAPFGRPVFVLTADDDRATLVLPRDERILADAPPDRVVEALAGVALTPDALRTIVAGCGLSSTAPTTGRSYGADRASVTLDDSTTFLRRDGSSWHVMGAVRDPLTVFYDDYVNGRPTTIRIRTSGRTAADLTLRLSQVEVNTALDPKAFQASPPERASPLTLEELRRAGPLGEKGGE